MVSHVEKQNIREYECLFRLENALRHFIIQELEPVAGSSRALIKQRLPAGEEDIKRIKENIARGREEQQKKDISDSSYYHPLYWVDFVDLVGTIKRKNNWNEVFQEKFDPVTHENFVQRSTDCFPVRNRIAHSRHCLEQDYATLQLFTQQVESAVGGPECYQELFEKSFDVANADKKVKSYLESIYNGAKKINDLQVIDEQIISELGCIDGVDFILEMVLSDHQIESVLLLQDLIIGYSKLPRGRGSISTRRGWKHRGEVKEILKDLQLGLILKSREDNRDREHE